MTHNYRSSMESLAESRFESDTDENDRAASRMFSDTVNTPAPEEDPTVVLVGEQLRQDAELISVITDRFGLEIAFSDHGTEYITSDEKGGASASQNLVFVVSDFEGGDFNYLNGYTRIVSPVAIRYCARNGKKFPIVRARRPLYCYAMRGMSFALDGYSRKECRRAVNLIHFMGGSARKEYRNPLILIAKKADSIIAKNALAASTAETPVLTLEWIEACWKLRDDTEFVATDQAMTERYKFKCFQGLSIFFLAFPEGSNLDEMTKKTIELNGSLAKTYKEATHVVCDIDFRAKQVAWNDMAPEFPHPKAAHVTAEWFWQSVHRNQCLREDLYPAIRNHEYRPLQPKENLRKRNAVSPVADEVLKGRRNNSSKASLDNSVDNTANSSLPEHMFSSDALDEIVMPKKHDKRFQVCMEMLETEENYLRMLKLIHSVYRDPLEECLKGDKPDLILSRGEIKRIFDKVGPLIPVHENILEQLRCKIKNWNPHQLVGLVWAHGANDMVKVYSQYVNSYDEALKTLEECDESRPKFHSFLKAGEANPSCQKNSLKDMLIRPVQRIPSVLLLLRELKKRTEKHHPDFQAITEGIQMVEKVLEKTNESRRQTETFERFMGVCNDIEDFPLELISSSREFISQAEFTLLEVDAAGPLSHNKNRPVSLLLFNDVVVVSPQILTPL
ncbi:RhoGEF domain containing protein [Aphelenchoides avenae]|nr:RhoGEF domain containing protein [Aphelenchus avenae]